VLAAMPEPYEPVGIATWPNPQTEARQLGVPNAIFALSHRQLAPSQVAVKQCPVPGLVPLGDQMTSSLALSSKPSRFPSLAETIQLSAAPRLSSRLNVSDSDFSRFFPMRRRYIAHGALHLRDRWPVLPRRTSLGQRSSARAVLRDLNVYRQLSTRIWTIVAAYSVRVFVICAAKQLAGGQAWQVTRLCFEPDLSKGSGATVWGLNLCCSAALACCSTS
jgi:hypothetical protein